MKNETDLEKLRQETEKLAEKYQLDLLLLFGSRAKGKTHSGSDYDFGYIARCRFDYKDEFFLQKELARIFGIKMNEKEDVVEVVDLNEAGPLFKYQVLKNNKVIHQLPGMYSRFFTRSLQEYFDSSRLFRMREKIISNKINSIRKSL